MSRDMTEPSLGPSSPRRGSMAFLRHGGSVPIYLSVMKSRMTRGQSSGLGMGHSGRTEDSANITVVLSRFFLVCYGRRKPIRPPLQGDHLSCFLSPSSLALAPPFQLPLLVAAAVAKARPLAVLNHRFSWPATRVSASRQSLSLY